MNFIKKNGLFIVESILLFILCSFFVPTCDDIIFKLDDFFQFENTQQMFHAVLYYGNGRFAGNFLLLVFSRIPQVFYVLQFIMLVSFSILLEKLLQLKNLREYILCVIVLAPLPLFKECVAWMSAVINYFIPVYLLVLTAFILKACFVKNELPSFIRGGGVLLLGFIGQLFVEHYAVLNLITAVFAVAFFKMKNKKTAAPLLLLFSELAGAGLLFSYKLYVDESKTWAANHLSVYRRLIFDEGSLGGMIKFAVTNVSYLVFIYAASVAVFTLLFVVCLHCAKGKKIKAKPLFCALSSFYYPLCAFCVFCQITQNTSNKVVLASGALVAVSAVGILGLFLQTAWQDLLKKQRRLVLCCVFIAALYFAPFLLVQPCSYRNCFMTYLILSVTVFYIADIQRRRNGFALDTFNAVLQAVSIVVICIYIGFYHYEKNTIYKYKIENYQTEYLLPRANDRLVYAAENNWPGKHKFVDYGELKKD